ncbi:MAG: M15 family metallopeptidase [Bacteroidota bacterium]
MKHTYLFLIGLLLSFSACKTDSRESNKQKEKSISQATVSEATSNTPLATGLIKNLTTDYCMGKFEPVNHEDFELIPTQYADRGGLYLRKDVLEAYIKMYNAAKKDGIALQIRSATRNFNYQKGIWERKWTGATKLSDGTNAAKDIQNPVERALKILEYSSMPGTSRHHWGTDIDLNSFSNAYFEKGEGKLIYDWLSNNAATYGFCQSYTPKGSERPTGYNEEKWHWTYQVLGKEITLYARQNLKNAMITGFQGAETAGVVDVVGNYVLGINQECNR